MAAPTLLTPRARYGYQPADGRTRRYDAPAARTVSRYDAPTSGSARRIDAPAARLTSYRVSTRIACARLTSESIA